MSSAVEGVGAPVRQADKKGIWGWMLFDWAQQPFHTLIITFIFAPYFAASVAPSAIKGQEWWGYAAGAGGFLVAILAPILGSISDATGPRKPWIFVLNGIGVVCIASLWFVTPAASFPMILLGLSAFALALAGFEFSAVFNNAMMPGLVSRERLGALSGNAWALGYAGGLICLVAMLTLMVASPETGKTLIGITPILGLDAAQQQGERASGLLTAIWCVIFLIPMFLFTPDAGRRAKVSGAVIRGLKELGETLRTLPRQRSLFAFLLSSMFYRDALNGLYAFGGIYARGVLGWSTLQLGVFGILASVAGVFGCVTGGWLDNRVGTKNIVSASIIALIVASLIVVSTAPNEVVFMTVAEGSGLPDTIFYLAGCLIGAAGGALQASSRPLLIDQTDPDDAGKAFGLYALSGRATAFMAPIAVGLATGIFENQRIGITPLIILFVIGLVLLIPVRSRT